MRRLLLALALAGCGPAPVHRGDPSQRDIDDPAGTLARLAGEPEGPTRRDLVTALRRAPAARALPVLRTGLASPDPAVRAAAALASGRRFDGETLADLLLPTALDDADPKVRLAATRSLGLLRVPEAFAPLQVNLSHKSADVRLVTLRALARIDAERAAELPELARLQLDADARIADSATKVARRVKLP